MIQLLKRILAKLQSYNTQEDERIESIIVFSTAAHLDEFFNLESEPTPYIKVFKRSFLPKMYEWIYYFSDHIPRAKEVNPMFNINTDKVLRTLVDKYIVKNKICIYPLAYEDLIDIRPGFHIALGKVFRNFQVIALVEHPFIDFEKRQKHKLCQEVFAYRWKDFVRHTLELVSAYRKNSFIIVKSPVFTLRSSEYDPALNENFYLQLKSDFPHNSAWHPRKLKEIESEQLFTRFPHIPNIIKNVPADSHRKVHTELNTSSYPKMLSAISYEMFLLRFITLGQLVDGGQETRHTNLYNLMK